MAFKNYLFSLYPNFPRDFLIQTRKDPDTCNGELYSDLLTVFFGDKQLKSLGLASVKKEKQKYQGRFYYTLFVNKGNYLLSSDYIGASIYWAIEAGLNKEEIVQFLKISRTLGGHIVFPRGNGTPTINQARGGEKTYYDRFDLTLLALKKWYLGDADTRIGEAIERGKDWFNLFGRGIEGFHNFIHFFHLEDFLFEDDKIIDLIDSDLDQGIRTELKTEKIDIPKDKEGYKRYFRNSNQIVRNRTTILERLLKG